MKKLTSLILALVMCLALGVPAFATETGNLDTEVEVLVPTLDVTIPDSATILLNPYRMSYTVTGTVTGIETGDRFQIMNGVFSFESKTAASVEVKATFTGEVGGDTTFSEDPVAPGDTGKNVYLTLTYATQAKASADVPAVEYDANNKPTNLMVITDSEQKQVWTLPPAVVSGSTTTQQRIDMQFGGSCSDAPEESPWTDSDTVGCGIVFEVIPVTDIPMVAATFDIRNSATPDLVVETFAPTDAKSGSGANYTVVKVESLNPSTGALTAVSDIEGSTWTGTKVTIPNAKISTTMGNSATTKHVKITLSYKDNTTAAATQTVEYQVKVKVVK